MKPLARLSLTILFCAFTCFNPVYTQAPSAKNQVNKTIFVYGNGMDKKFIRYVADLTGKRNPDVCFVTTGAADNPRVIQYLEELTEDLPLNPKFLVTFITSSPEQESFEDIIMSSDAIMVGGGNTLNMLGIWKAQGIDTLMRQAYEKGIILAGGSAGSLCWFKEGITDSRPKELTIMECLGFLKYSHSPHYNDETRRQLYNDAIREGGLCSGFGIEDGAGLLFVNGEMRKAISLDGKYNSYFVSVRNGRISEEKLKSEVLR
jgi:peptidase E